MSCLAEKSRTSPAMCEGRLEGSMRVIVWTPGVPAASADQNAAGPDPIGLMTPNPVSTVRREVVVLSVKRWSLRIAVSPVSSPETRPPTCRGCSAPARGQRSCRVLSSIWSRVNLDGSETLGLNRLFQGNSRMAGFFAKRPIFPIFTQLGVTPARQG